MEEIWSIVAERCVCAVVIGQGDRRGEYLNSVMKFICCS